MKNNNKLMKLSNITTASFLDKVKERYVEKYADDVLVLIEDKKKLEKALASISKILTKIENGDIEAVEEYKKARKRLEVEANGELE